MSNAASDLLANWFIVRMWIIWVSASTCQHGVQCDFCMYELDHFIILRKKTCCIHFCNKAFTHFTYFFLTPRSGKPSKEQKRWVHVLFAAIYLLLFLYRNGWIPLKVICRLPPIRLASDESRSPPMVLVAGGVAGGTAATPVATGVPPLPAVLPAVLPPVLCGVTAGISKSPNPPNTWVGSRGGETSVEEGRRQQVPDLVAAQSGGRWNSRLLSERTNQLQKHQLAVPHMHNKEGGCGYSSALRGIRVKLVTFS